MYCHYQLSDVVEEYCEAYSSDNVSLVREALQYLFINVTRWKYIKKYYCEISKFYATNNKRWTQWLVLLSVWATLIQNVIISVGWY